MRGSRDIRTILGCFLTVVSVGHAVAATGEPVVRHTVRRGQTLYSIARSYGVPLSGLAAANGIRNPSRVRAGTRLVIPGARRRAAVGPRPSAPALPPVANPPVANPPVATPPVALPPRSAQDVPAPLAPSLLPALPDLPSRPALLPWPVDGPVLSGFDRPRRGHRHRGIDIGAPEGAPVRAVAGGVVTLAANQYGRYGRLVTIEHDDGTVSYYGHNLKNLVERGQRVSADEVIALVGRSGNASCSHLHFELRRNGEAIDPTMALAPQP